MKFISFLIKPASSLCNMQCHYCFYNDVSNHRALKSYGIMQKQVMFKLIDQALAFDDAADITFAFQGGEPTLTGIDYFKAFIGYVNLHKKKQTIHYALQTNALLLNNEWATFFYENQFLVGISLDGFKQNHDYFRKDLENGDTFEQVMNAIELLRNKHVEFNILSVLTSSLAKHPHKLFSFYQKHDFRYVQLIPCIHSFDENSSADSLSPKQFAKFYIQYFDMWIHELKQGNYFSVTLFDNIVHILAGNMPQQCGMLGYCTPQFVIESNGNVFPCDFYVLDQYCCGNIVEDDLLTLTRNKILDDFLLEPKRACNKCIDCPFENLCHKNCKRLNHAYYDENYCGYRQFLEYAYLEMLNVVSMLK